MKISAGAADDLLNGYAKSGLSVKKYAILNGVGYSTLQRWLQNEKTFCKADSRSQFSSTCEDTSDSAIHFIDITPPVAQTALFSTERHGEDLHVQQGVSVNGIPCAAIINGNPSIKDRTHEVSPAFHQLEVFLPNGIRVTLHQTSLDVSMNLIKALV